MKEKILLFVLAIVCLTSGGSVLAQEKPITRQEMLRGTITPEREWWDLLHYDLSVQFMPETKSIKGSNVITFKTLKAGSKMQIDLQTPLAITKITHGGVDLKYEREGNVYWVTFDKQLPARVEDEVSIWYEGKPTVATNPPWNGGVQWAKDETGKWFINTSCEGIGAGKIDQLSPRELQVAERAAQGESNKQIADRLGLSEHTVKNYLFHVFEKLGVSNRFELLFLLFKECNGSTADRAAVTLATEQGHPIETYLTAAEEGSVAAQFVVGLAHLEGYCVEKNGLSAYYWLRLAETSSQELGQRSRVLVEQLRSAVQAHEIEDVEHRISIAVKKNKLLQSQRPDELIKRTVASRPLRIAI